MAWLTPSSCLSALPMSPLFGGISPSCWCPWRSLYSPWCSATPSGITTSSTPGSLPSPPSVLSSASRWAQTIYLLLELMTSNVSHRFQSEIFVCYVSQEIKSNQTCDLNNQMCNNNDLIDVHIRAWFSPTKESVRILLSVCQRGIEWRLIVFCLLSL